MNIFPPENLLKDTFFEIKIDKTLIIKTSMKALTSFINMFLTNKTRIKIKDIVKRISLDEPVSLEERIYVEKFSKRNSTMDMA